MTREIVLDTETTGFDPEDGHRIVEIGCIELINHIPSGRTLQLYINPERDVPSEASAVHGLTDKFLADKPVFSQVYSDFVEFIGDARLVAHNAEFDIKFINWELKKVGHPVLAWSRVTDTLQMARTKFPGSPANLDALCRRFGIDNSERTFHGALLDSELLAEVYLELLGGRQHMLLGVGTKTAAQAVQEIDVKTVRVFREARIFTASQSELASHKELLKKLKNALWLKGAA